MRPVREHRPQLLQTLIHDDGDGEIRGDVEDDIDVVSLPLDPKQPSHRRNLLD